MCNTDIITSFVKSPDYRSVSYTHLDVYKRQEVETAFDMITYNGAKCLNIHDQYGIEVGRDANFIVLDLSLIHI